MTAPADVRKGLATIIGTSSLVRAAYAHPQTSYGQSPMAFVVSLLPNYELVVGGDKAYQADIRLTLAVAANDETDAFDRLDAMLDPDKSGTGIVAVIHNNDTLDGSVDQIVVRRVENYGLRGLGGESTPYAAADLVCTYVTQ